MKRLIWLRGSGITGGSGTYETITGNPVSFTAKAAPLKQLKVAFSPKQDLHGYDAPWPAGGGKNKFDPSAATDGKRLDNEGGLVNSANWCVSDWIPVTPNTDYYAKYVIPAANGYAFCFYDSSKAFLRYAVVSGGGEAVRNSGADAAYMRCTIRLEDKATAGIVAQSSEFLPYSPYSNLCPILGWDSLNVWQRGKNLWNPAACTKVGWNIEWANPVKGFPVGTSVTFSTEPFSGGNGALLQYLDATDTWKTISTWQFGKTELVKTVTITAEMSAASKMHFSGQSNTFSAEEIEAAHFQIELSDERTEYQPYNGRSISITLGETVYSGTVDVVTGVGEEDKIDEQLNAEKCTSLSLTYGGANYPNIAYCRIYLDSEFDATYTEWLSNVGSFVGAVSSNGAKARAENGETLFSPSTGTGTGKYIHCIFNKQGATTYEEAYAVLFNSDVHVVYPLLNPIHIQLTPQEVSSLAGDNTMWSDANENMTVEYRSN